MDYKQYIKIITFDENSLEPVQKLSHHELINHYYKLLMNKTSYWNDFLLSETICEFYQRRMDEQIEHSRKLKLFR